MISFFPLGAILYSRSDDGGTTWSAPVVVAAAPLAPAGNGFPFLTVDPTGENIHVCFSEIPDAGMPNETFLVSARSINGGQNFEAAEDVSRVAGNAALLCRNAIGPAGQVYVVFSEQDTPTDEGQVMFSVSTDNGLSYSTPKPVNSVSANQQAFGMLAVDSLGRLDVIWSSDTDGVDEGDTIMYSRSSDEGATFSVEAPISAAGSAVLPLGLRHDDSGRVHVLFMSDINDPGNSFDVFYLVGE